MYNSFIEAADWLSGDDFKDFIKMLRDYALYGELRESDNPSINALMTMAKPNLDSARNRYEAAKKNGEKGKKDGWKGGRPRKTPEITPEITPEKPQSKPLNDNVEVDVNDNVEVDRNEKENRDFYDTVDVYADGDVEVDDYGTDNADDYPDEDWYEEEEDNLDEDEEPIPSDSSNGLGDYLETIKPNTHNDYYQQDREPQPDSEDIALSNKPISNLSLPTNRQELLQCYQESLNLLQQYDINHWEYDSQSKESLRLATSALMKIMNISFQQAKEHIAAVRSQHRQDNG